MVRPLEASAREKGVKFLLNYKMSGIIREGAPGQPSGRVLGITAQYTPTLLPGSTTPLRSYRSDGNVDRTDPNLTIRAHKAVIVATGGSTSNVNFRRMFDPRLTEVYQVAGEPYTYQDASGELAAMAVGASLWGLANQILENGDNIRVKRALGTRWNYFAWELESPIFPLVGAAGLAVKDWHDLILVNQVGERFYDETQGDYPEGNKHKDIDPYTPGDHRNTHIEYDPHHSNFFNAAVAMNAGSKAPDYSGGPVWAIFDSDAVEREGWKGHPAVRRPGRLFLHRRHPGRAGRRHREPLAGRAHERRRPGNRGAPLQLIRGFRHRRGLRQALPQVQDPDAALPRRLGHPPGPRQPGRAAHRREVPSAGHGRPGHPRPLLRRGVRGRLQPARHGALHGAGLHRREAGRGGAVISAFDKRRH